METMSKFKVGDRVLVTSRNPTASKLIQIGDIRIVTDTCVDVVRLDDILTGWLFHSNIELVTEDIKPKWTIYNNDKPWEDLSDKQKGKMLLAAHGKVLFKMGKSGVILDRVRFSTSDTVYQAVEPVKPEPTMAEKFIADAGDWDFKSSNDFSGYMIAKGWNKP
jgi:hypothetical protein